jgi:pantoate--beta-alanine ligase
MEFCDIKTFIYNSLTMQIIRTKEGIRQKVAGIRNRGLSIGFIPTMGALHAGHLSLIENAKNKSDITICSIFVNPLQFNDTKDFETYPRQLEHDIQVLKSNGCDILFLPAKDEIYVNSTNPRPIDLIGMDLILEGEKRPEHFQGVAQIVTKLLDIIETDYIFLGQKDYQQCVILRHLIKNILKWDIEILVCPIVREKDGLAMSSRNQKLSLRERNDAPILYKMLQYANKHAPHNNFNQVKKHINKVLLKISTIQKIDYIEMIDGNTLNIVEDMNDADKIVVCIAVYFQSARLIDNIILKDNN